MATENQIAANRRNAEKSTGPRSAEGKAASSRNALKTGLYCRGIIIGKEDPTKLDELEAAFTAEYAPATPTERSLVDSLIHLEWMLRRYRWLESETWYATLDRLTPEQREATWTGHAFIDHPAISRIHRLRTSTQRSFHETVSKLRAIQKERAAGPATAPDVDAQPVETTTHSPEIGFVPSNSCERAADGPAAGSAIEPGSLHGRTIRDILPPSTREDSPCS